MAIAQNYVSNELSHFVGRGKTEKEQYDLLVNKILKTGWLTHGPHHDPTVPRTANLDLSKPISRDEAIRYQVVCFCDIPETELSIHVGKYSKFGLAFQKDFLIAAGASPVFYVANESLLPLRLALFKPGDFRARVEAAQAKGAVDRALYFDTSVRAIIDILAAFDALCSPTEDARYFKGGGLSVSECKERIKTLLGLNDAHVTAIELALRSNAQTPTTLVACSDFLLNYVFSFIKCFDAKRPLDDETHYYMEREWRVAGNVHFGLPDVARIFLPSRYADRLRADLSAYKGQISFLE